jgi:hypothetical protein
MKKSKNKNKNKRSKKNKNKRSKKIYNIIGSGSPSIFPTPTPTPTPIPPNIIDEYNRAIMEGNYDIIERLLRTYPIDVNSIIPGDQRQFNNPSDRIVHIGMTPLYYVVSRYMTHLPYNQQYLSGISGRVPDNYYRIAQLLIDRGANVNATTTQWFRGWAPIHWAAEYENIDMMQLLLRNGANLEQRYDISLTGDSLGINDCLFMRFYASNDGKPEIRDVPRNVLFQYIDPRYVL